MLIEPQSIVLKNGQSVLLKSPEPADAYNLLQHLKVVFSESYKNMNYPANHWDNFPVSDEEKILADFSASSSKFMVSAFYENSIVGNLGLFGSTGDFVKHNARLGMGIEQRFCGLGLGSAMLRHAIRQSKRLNIHRIELTVRTFNKAGINLYEKVGFEKVGLLKDVAFIDGHYCDEYIYQILIGSASHL